MLEGVWRSCDVRLRQKKINIEVEEVVHMLIAVCITRALVLQLYLHTRSTAGYTRFQLIHPTSSLPPLWEVIELTPYRLQGIGGILNIDGDGCNIVDFLE